MVPFLSWTSEKLNPPQIRTMYKILNGMTLCFLINYIPPRTEERVLYKLKNKNDISFPLARTIDLGNALPLETGRKGRKCFI